MGASVPPPEPGGRLALASHCALKRLETPALYDIPADALFELDEEALRFLAAGPPRCDERRSPETATFVDFCLAEGLLVQTPAAAPVAVPDAPPLVPSLRYLLVHLTDRCTLRCRHCFIGTQTGTDLPLADLTRLADEFAALQGLRFIVSGGEPLLHRHFWKLNERLPAYPFRSILLTNGTMLDREAARALRFHEVQVSLDGPQDAHDLLRGTGSHRRALAALRHLAEAGVPISVASVVFAGNLGRFDELETILKEFPLRAWSIDVPCPAGAMADNPALLPGTAQAAALMARSFGDGYYGSSGGWACGAHLAAVMADGTIDKCGYFTGRRSGHIREGLAAAWRRIPRWRLEELTCSCSHLAECRGGCRFRAQAHGDLLGPDPAMCSLRGVPVGGDRPGLYLSAKTAARCWLA
ncbi:MAG: radical SAM protein [Candidatus Methylomirabilia bacterium]